MHGFVKFAQHEQSGGVIGSMCQMLGSYDP
jgi:hypothetical protein